MQEVTKYIRTTSHVYLTDAGDAKIQQDDIYITFDGEDT